ncbi:MAG: hypothetical protein JW741_04425 [Sedimentisphaerales bacterium]|nr:hypothetical protein [Sedimentisphaerales bacterium]
MKHTNTIVFVIVTAAVLLTAYGVGLLIRQARMRPVGADRHAVAAPNDTPAGEAAADDYGPGRGRRQRLAQEDPAKAKQEKAEMLEKMSNLTEPEQEQFRQQVRERFSTSGRGTAADLEREKRQQMFEKWQTMSEEEKEKLRAQVEARLRARRQRELAMRPGAITDANATTDPEADGRVAEPNQAGQS